MIWGCLPLVGDWKKGFVRNVTRSLEQYNTIPKISNNFASKLIMAIVTRFIKGETGNVIDFKIFWCANHNVLFVREVILVCLSEKHEPTAYITYAEYVDSALNNRDMWDLKTIFSLKNQYQLLPAQHDTPLSQHLTFSKSSGIFLLR